MRNKYIIIVFTMLFFITALPFNAIAEEGLLTLREAKELAVKNSTLIQQYQLNIDKADKAKREADEAYSKILANYFTEAQETMVVNAREGYRAALNAYIDSKKLYENTKIKLEYDVENLYFTILNTENELKVLEYDLRLQADLAKIESLKLTLGMSTENNVQQVEVMLNSLHTAYNAKNIQLQNYKSAMNRYIGREPNSTLKLEKVSNIDFKKEITTVNDTYEKAIENNLSIYQYERTIEEKVKDIDWYGYNQSDKVENLNNSIKEAKIAKENTEKSLKQSIINIYEKLALNQRNISTCTINLQVARENNKFSQQRYQLGMISQIELLSAQKALAQAEKDYIQAEYDYYLALRELELAERGIIFSSN